MSDFVFAFASFEAGSITECGFSKTDIFADYFTKVLEDNLKAVVKPQYVDQLPDNASTNLPGHEAATTEDQIMDDEAGNHSENTVTEAGGSVEFRGEDKTEDPDEYIKKSRDSDHPLGHEAATTEDQVMDDEAGNHSNHTVTQANVPIRIIDPDTVREPKPNISSGHL
ncbi:hypothetical protein EJ06DRAFT_552058 [Trichodelitschia bisporula]|uniref:Uncharacterized protein n=1 Tax=Trichodelitschia bisporula TaxID=703511 RepID=A0A6G1HII7_9PEZI|nr:hypothetical protein EJ06DRAFT_552058 [Trichodelitschia bisporula]